MAHKDARQAVMNMEQSHSESKAHAAFLASEFAPAKAGKATFTIIPVPLERSVSYGGGTANGPQAILEASQQLEALENGLAPGDVGIYTAPFVDCSGSAGEVLGRIEEAVRKAIAHKSIPIVLGGEHSASLGALRVLAQAAKSQGETFGVIQFDAHADLRDAYQGDPYSHASVMRRVIDELNLPLVQFAVREISPEEVEVRERMGLLHYDAYFLARVGLPEKPLPEEFPRRIYISFDLDAFDSALMPATGTPSPGGLNWREAHFILECCAKGREIIGFDVMELAPIQGLHHANFTAAKITHLLMALTLQCRIDAKLAAKEAKA